MEEWIMAIRRNISLLSEGIVAEIDIVYRTDLVPIEFFITDYVIPNNAIATLYCITSADELFKAVGTITNNIISFELSAGFFTVGRNCLQIRIAAEEKELYSFEVNVSCKRNIASDDAQEVESQPTLMAQLLTEVANTKSYVNEEVFEMKEEIGGVSNLVNLLVSQRSHIGSIVQSATLDTEEKVINLYGGTKWELIQGKFLLGKSDEYEIGTTGGESKHTLTTEEMPVHKHSGSTSTGITDTMRVVSAAGAKYNSNHATGYESSVYEDVSIGFPGGNHWHNFTTSNVGNGSPHNNMPPYKTVYIWERVE